MKPNENFRAYRRVFAAPDDSSVCWWYSGWTLVTIEGYPDIPLSQIAAVMTYRTETLSPGRFRVHWNEIGCFRDPVTGELPQGWTNPLTGKKIDTPRTFREGPGSYTVSATDDGVSIELDQPNASVLETRVDFHVTPERFWFTQLERKIRGFPLPDGTMSPLASSGYAGLTQLAFYARAQDALGNGSDFVPADGSYSFRLNSLPPSLGFGSLAGACNTWGTVTKARPGQPLDRGSWERIAQLFPGGS